MRSIISHEDFLTSCGMGTLDMRSPPDATMDIEGGLLCAAYTGNKEVCEYLINHGATRVTEALNSHLKVGWLDYLREIIPMARARNAYHPAIIYVTGHYQCYKYLVENGAVSNARYPIIVNN